MRLIALGDSLTQGVGDPRPGRAGFRGELDGWVAHFARQIAASGEPIDVVNLGAAGARLAHVVNEQLPSIDRRAIRADVVSCFIGVNDLWDIGVDLDRFAEQFDATFARLKAVAPIVITASIHDVFAFYPLKKALKARLHQNIAEMNAVIASTVARHDLVLLDLAGQASIRNRRVMAVDGLHPNRYGHQRIAAEVLLELQRRGELTTIAEPVATPIRRGSSDVAHVVWVARFARQNWGYWREQIQSNRSAYRRL